MLRTFENARDIVIEGYDDWYVPTKWELNKGLDKLSASVREFLWSSSESFNSQGTIDGKSYTNVIALTKVNASTYKWDFEDKTLTAGKARVLPFRSFGE